MHGVLFDSVAANTATRRFITLTPQNLYTINVEASSATAETLEISR